VGQQAAHELNIRQAGDWRWTAEEEDAYNYRLRDGEIPGDDVREDLVYYLAVQPGRA
jgi:hypothetical protein